MNDSDVWSVDRLAASHLAAELHAKLATEDLDRIARHFARHRREACEWAAKRVHANVLKELAAASMDLFDRKCEAWTEGFQGAEQLVMTLPPHELVGIDAGKGRSKGQLLRALVRQARSRTGTS